MKKQTKHIRTTKEDAMKWKKYCDALGTSSSQLFSKVMTSENINMKKRVKEEMDKKIQKNRREFL